MLWKDFLAKPYQLVQFSSELQSFMTLQFFDFILQPNMQLAIAIFKNRSISNYFDYINFPMIQIDEKAIKFAAIGGCILGIATSLNYILRGKVTGMSGIVYGITSFNRKQMPQKLTIVGGMLVASSLVFKYFGYGNINGFQPFGPQAQLTKWVTPLGFAIAGFLVGFGTKLSNGCTSGHGLCGLSRFSLRSFVAVCTFLMTAIVVGTACYHMNGIPGIVDYSISESSFSNVPKISHAFSSAISLGLGILFPIVGFLISRTNKQKLSLGRQIVDQCITFSVGALFAVGLMVAGMSRRQNIIRFLQIGTKWNPALLFVLGCGLIINVILFNYMLKTQKKSVLGNELFNPSNSKIDFKLLFGAICFGTGWGIGGICPGPFLVLSPVATFSITVVFGINMLAGMFTANKFANYLDNQHKNKAH